MDDVSNEYLALSIRGGKTLMEIEILVATFEELAKAMHMKPDGVKESADFIRNNVFHLRQRMRENFEKVADEDLPNFLYGQ